MELVDIYDNGGETVDRYMVILPDGSVYTMSDDPDEYMGVCLYSGTVDDIHASVFNEQVRIPFTEAPESVQKKITALLTTD